jgi:hypothetical protein
MAEGLFGGPDSPTDESQTPADIDIEDGDEFADGFGASPRQADLDAFAQPFQRVLEEKVDTYNGNFEDASDRNDEVTDDMVAAVAHRARGAYVETHDPEAEVSTDWVLGRVNEFLERAANLDEDAGFEVDDAYRQDDDLLPRGFEASTLEDDEVNPGNGPDLR